MANFLKYAAEDCVTILDDSKDARWPKVLYGIEGAVKHNVLLGHVEMKRFDVNIAPGSVPGTVLACFTYTMVNKISRQAFSGDMMVRWTLKESKIAEERFFGGAEPAAVACMFSHLDEAK